MQRHELEEKLEQLIQQSGVDKEDEPMPKEAEQILEALIRMPDIVLRAYLASRFRAALAR